MAKVSKSSVRYRPARRTGPHCGSCVMFRPSAAGTEASSTVGSCTLVDGVITSGSVCDRWQPQKGSGNHA